MVSPSLELIKYESICFRDIYVYQSRSDRDLKSCQVIASEKSKLLRKVDFLRKSGFQVIAFFVPVDIKYLVMFVVNFVYK